MSAKSSKSHHKSVLFFVTLLSFFLMPFITHALITNAIDPNGDGNTVQGKVYNCGGGGNYDCMNDGTRHPTAPSVSDDYVSLGVNKVDFYQMTSMTNVALVDTITVWFFHEETEINTQTEIALFQFDEVTPFSTAVLLLNRANAQWDSATFTNLTGINQDNLDGLKIQFKCVKNGSGKAGNCNGYALYGIVHYEPAISVEILDENNNSVVMPTVEFEDILFNFKTQQSAGILGDINEKIRLKNITFNAPWSLAIAASNGPSSLWEDGDGNTYDYNGNASDGQLLINPSASTINFIFPATSNRGISQGSLAGFQQGVIDSITLFSADTNADAPGIWDFTNIKLTQNIPAGQTPGAYTIDMTLTAS